MKHILAISVIALSLAACSGDPAKDAAVVQGYEQAFLPIGADAMCKAQAAANAAGEVAQKNGDEAGAAQASMASMLVGVGCTWGAPPVAK